MDGRKRLFVALGILVSGNRECVRGGSGSEKRCEIQEEGE